MLRTPSAAMAISLLIFAGIYELAKLVWPPAKVATLLKFLQ